MASEDVKKLINSVLDLISAIDEETLKKWIYTQWPHAFGLYD